MRNFAFTLVILLIIVFGVFKPGGAYLSFASDSPSDTTRQMLRHSPDPIARADAYVLSQESGTKATPEQSPEQLLRLLSRTPIEAEP
jgi:hypothetical protein